MAHLKGHILSWCRYILGCIFLDHPLLSWFYYKYQRGVCDSFDTGDHGWLRSIFRSVRCISSWRKHNGHTLICKDYITPVCSTYYCIAIVLYVSYHYILNPNPPPSKEGFTAGKKTSHCLQPCGFESHFDYILLSYVVKPLLVVEQHQTQNWTACCPNRSKKQCLVTHERRIYTSLPVFTGIYILKHLVCSVVSHAVYSARHSGRIRALRINKKTKWWPMMLYTCSANEFGEASTCGKYTKDATFSTKSTGSLLRSWLPSSASVPWVWWPWVSRWFFFRTSLSPVPLPYRRTACLLKPSGTASATCWTTMRSVVRRRVGCASFFGFLVMTVEITLATIGMVFIRQTRPGWRGSLVEQLSYVTGVSHM